MSRRGIVLGAALTLVGAELSLIGTPHTRRVRADIREDVEKTHPMVAESNVRKAEEALTAHDNNVGFIRRGQAHRAPPRIESPQTVADAYAVLHRNETAKQDRAAYEHKLRQERLGLLGNTERWVGGALVLVGLSLFEFMRERLMWARTLSTNVQSVRALTPLENSRRTSA